MSSIKVAPAPTVSRMQEPALQLLDYCRKSDWAGWDPFDGLNSPLFRLPFLQSRWPRLGFIQGFKRSPINLRSFFGVPREINPKGIALFASSLMKLEAINFAERSEAIKLLKLLLETRTKGQKEVCWGYNFDWQTRYYLVPKFTPNIICTTFAGNTLLEAYERYGDNASLDAAVSAGQFILNSLNRSQEGSTFCFSYTPLDKSKIHNANLLGAAFLARLYQHTRAAELPEVVNAAAAYSLNLMRADGSWPYGEGPKQAWIDSFHTGYNLVALDRIQRALPSDTVETAIEKGYRYYLDHFFNSDGSVKYFHNNTYPIDAHAIAQAVETLVAMGPRYSGGMELSEKIFDWAIANMRHPDGWFYYQKHPRWTNRIPYIRWCQAWMIYAFSIYLEEHARIAAR